MSKRIIEHYLVEIARDGRYKVTNIYNESEKYRFSSKERVARFVNVQRANGHYVGFFEQELFNDVFNVNQ